MIELALPWGMSYMIQQNGYDPLYAYLLRNPPADVKLNCLDDVKTRQNLQNNPDEICKLIERGRDCLKGLPDFFASFFNQSDTYLLELGLAAEIPGDIEFVHTSPVVTGIRPFILHIEGFFSLFLPFERDPEEIIKDDFPLKNSMRTLLESDKCIGIYSHLKQTIKEINLYFDSEIIKNKLSHVPIGYDGTIISQQDKRKSLQEAPTFLALSSAHINSNNFISIGGNIILATWDRIRSRYPNAKLIWQTKKPTKEDCSLIEADITSDLDELIDSAIWIERYINDKELDNLFAASDFVLIPSLWLHSTTILRAIASKCIPVVSDTPLIDEYRESGCLVVTKGVRNTFWKQIGSIFAPQKLPFYNRNLVDSLSEILFESIRSKEKLIGAHMNAIIEHYSGRDRATQFYDLVKARFSYKISTRHRRSKSFISLRADLSTISRKLSSLRLKHVTDPVLHENIDKETFSREISHYYQENIPRVIFSVADRIHVANYYSWPYLAETLDGCSAYAFMLSHDYAVYAEGSVVSIIDKIHETQEKQLIRRYRNFLKSKQKQLDNSSNTCIDIELIQDMGESNLLRIYHLYVCYKKSLGPFPAEDFIRNPLKYSSMLFLTPGLARARDC